MNSKRTMSRQRRRCKRKSVRGNLHAFLHFLMYRAEAKETQIREQTAKIASLEEACQDLEGTIVRFRELVMQLQTCVCATSAHLTVLTTRSTES